MIQLRILYKYNYCIIRLYKTRIIMDKEIANAIDIYNDNYNT